MSDQYVVTLRRGLPIGETDRMVRSLNGNESISEVMEWVDYRCRGTIPLSVEIDRLKQLNVEDESD